MDLKGKQKALEQGALVGLDKKVLLLCSRSSFKLGPLISILNFNVSLFPRNSITH